MTDCQHQFEVRHEPGFSGTGQLMEISMVSRCKLCGVGKTYIYDGPVPGPQCFYLQIFTLAFQSVPFMLTILERTKDVVYSSKYWMICGNCAGCEAIKNIDHCGPIIEQKK